MTGKRFSHAWPFTAPLGVPKERISPAAFHGGKDD